MKKNENSQKSASADKMKIKNHKKICQIKKIEKQN